MTGLQELARQRFHHARFRINVMRRWPLLLAELLCVTLLVGVISGPYAVALFVLATLILLTAPLTGSDMIEAGERGGGYHMHLNLVLQKMACFLLVCFLIGSEIIQHPLHQYLIHGLLVPFAAAVMVATWWSPEIDSRWDVDDTADAAGRPLEGGMS